MTQIYHITHYSNLDGIIDKGGLLCDRHAQSVPHTRIGHQHIKDRRMNRRVPKQPGGTLGDYVPFSFAPRPPMLYAIHCGFVQGYAAGQVEVVHLVSTIEDVARAGLSWVFTDGHADMAYTDFYNRVDDLDKIDWGVMGSKYWNDTVADGDRCRRRQAEFLVHSLFPWELISQIGVHGEKTQQLVRGILRRSTHKPDVAIERNWYY